MCSHRRSIRPHKNSSFFDKFSTGLNKTSRGLRERERALASVFYTRLLRLSFYSWVIYRLLSNVACFRRRCERALKHVNAQRPPAFWVVGLPSQQGAPANASHDKSVPHKRCKVSPI